MTNGEKLQETFPNGVLTSINNSYYWGDDILVSKNWWNAEYKEPTTKNDLRVGCIDRKKLIDWINIWDITPIIKNPLIRHIQGMPSVTPQEPIKPVLEDIKADIENMLPDGGVIHKKTVIEIIDKYKGESGVIWKN